MRPQVQSLAAPLFFLPLAVCFPPPVYLAVEQVRTSWKNIYYIIYINIYIILHILYHIIFLCYIIY